MHSLPHLTCTPEAPDRRQWLRRAGAWPMACLVGCAAPWPEVPAGPGSPSARARLDESAAAHGLRAWRQVRDLSVGLSPLASGGRGADSGRVAGAGSLQWRCLPAQRLVAWHDEGRALPQQGWQRAADPVAGSTEADSSDLRLWQDGEPVTDPDLLVDAARQTGLLALLLLGPLLLAETRRPVNWAAPATLEGRHCDQLTLDLLPGLGGRGASRLALFIDRDEGLLRRLRVLSEAEQGRPGATAATWDLREPLVLRGIHWPRRCQRVTPLRGSGPGQEGWQLQGLDLDRGLQPADLTGIRFSALAGSPAAALPA